MIRRPPISTPSPPRPSSDPPAPRLTPCGFQSRAFVAPPYKTSRHTVQSPPAASPENQTPSRGSQSCAPRSEEHTSELQSQSNLVCRLLLEKKKITTAHAKTD